MKFDDTGFRTYTEKQNCAILFTLVTNRTAIGQAYDAGAGGFRICIAYKIQEAYRHVGIRKCFLSDLSTGI